MNLCKGFQDALKNDSLDNRNEFTCRSVHLSSKELNTVGTYQIKLNVDGIPRETAGLICYFPLHQDGPRHLYADNFRGKLDSFNKKLNQCIQNSRVEPDMARLIIFYGETVFEIHEIKNTVYIIWAEHINYANYNKVAATLFHNNPILFHLDGAFKSLNVFILKEKIQNNHELHCLKLFANSPVLYCRRNPFVCEANKKKHHRDKSKEFSRKKYTEDEVDRIVTSCLPEEELNKMIFDDHSRNEFSND
jgi:hypothetical protein